MKRTFVRIFTCCLFFAPGLTYAAYHQVVVGDTLTEIAESTYGNWVKWKDLWRLNEEHVSNPDLIYPGQRLKLFTEEELARLAENNPDAAAALGSQHANDGSSGMTNGYRRKHSMEWSLLPQQSWERFVFKTSPTIDAEGFDRRSKVSIRVADKSTPVSTIASDRIAILGEVVNARSEYERLFLGDQIFVRADEALQVGTTYSVTSGPQKLKSERDGRVGFGYDLTGKIRIVGVRDGLFIGTITALYYPIRRHHLLIPEVPDYSFPEAVAAPNAILASMVVPLAMQEEMIGQQKIVFLDVGRDEGVKSGMIFRHYLHVDPYSHQEITAKDFLIEAEMQVLSVQDKFSIAIITQSRSNIHYGDDLVALTDLSDYQKNQGIQSILQDPNKPVSVDDLDDLDHSDGLGEKENHDLRQLEKWAKPAPESNNGIPDPSASDEILRIDTHDHPNKVYEIGKEPAPNDQSGKPETAPAEPSPQSRTQTPDEGSASDRPPTATPSTTTPSTNSPPPLLDSSEPSTGSSSNGNGESSTVNSNAVITSPPVPEPVPIPPTTPQTPSAQAASESLPLGSASPNATPGATPTPVNASDPFATPTPTGP